MFSRFDRSLMCHGWTKGHSIYGAGIASRIKNWSAFGEIAGRSIMAHFYKQLPTAQHFYHPVLHTCKKMIKVMKVSYFIPSKFTQRMICEHYLV